MGMTAWVPYDSQDYCHGHTNYYDHDDYRESLEVLITR